MKPEVLNINLITLHISSPWHPFTNNQTLFINLVQAIRDIPFVIDTNLRRRTNSSFEVGSTSQVGVDEIGSTSQVGVDDKRKISDGLDEVDEEGLVIRKRVKRDRNV